MANETIGMFLIMAIMAIIVIGVFLGLWSVKYHHKKLLEYYDNIKIGDRYFFTVGPFHPFDTKQIYGAEIIDKALSGGKYPWVQYRYDDGSVSQDELYKFLEFHTKETN